MKDFFTSTYNFGMFDQRPMEEKLAAIQKIGFTGAEVLAPFNAELAALLDKYGLKVLDSNISLDEDMNCVINENIELMQKHGIKYVGCNPISYFDDRETMLKAAEILNRNGKKLSEYGIKASFHNHTGEFRFNEQEGEYLWETFAKNTDPNYVCFKLDVGWAHIAGVDVEYLIQKYSGRVELTHIKPCTGILGKEAAVMGRMMAGRPRRPAGSPPPAPPSTPPELPPEIKKFMELVATAQGPMKDNLQDLKLIMELAEKHGCKVFTLERDGFYLDDRIKVMEEDLAFIRTFW